MRGETNIPKNLFISHGEEVERILQQAVREALDTHKRLGHSVAVWQDGQIVILPPEQIFADEQERTFKPEVNV